MDQIYYIADQQDLQSGAGHYLIIQYISMWPIYHRIASCTLLGIRPLLYVASTSGSLSGAQGGTPIVRIRIVTSVYSGSLPQQTQSHIITCDWSQNIWMFWNFSFLLQLQMPYNIFHFFWQTLIKGAFVLVQCSGRTFTVESPQIRVIDRISNKQNQAADILLNRARKNSQPSSAGYNIYQFTRSNDRARTGARNCIKNDQEDEYTMRYWIFDIGYCKLHILTRILLVMQYNQKTGWLFGQADNIKLGGCPQKSKRANCLWAKTFLRLSYLNQYFLIYQIYINRVIPMPSSEITEATNTKSIVFAVLLIIYQVAACVLYSTVYGFRNDVFLKQEDHGGMFLIAGITILLIVGFGLINAYVTSSAISGLTYSFIIYCIAIQHFYFFRAFWNKSGTNDQFDSTKSFTQDYQLVTMSNYGVDRQSSTNLPSAAWVQGIACAIALNVGLSPVIGRIGLLEVFVLSIFGSFLYEVNAQLMWRWFVTDCGYGYRIFIFGSMLGIISSLILGRKSTTVQHPKYRSNLSNMAFSLFGFLIVWCTFPLLTVANIYTHSKMDNYILWSSPITMFLALASGVLGTFTASAITYRKFSVHDLIFTGLTGGIIFSSSPDVNWNPSVPLIVGYLIGLATSFRATKVHRWLNKNGVAYTHLHITRFLLPGLIAGALVAVLQAVGGTENGEYKENFYINQQRSGFRYYTGQGGFQVLGIAVTAGIGALAGAIIGVLYRVINKYEEQEQFEDAVVYTDIAEAQR